MLGHIYNQLLKEVKPVWYYYFQNESIKNYFSDYDKMSKEDRNIIPLSKDYSDKRMRSLDASFIAWNKGYIDIDSKKKYSSNFSINNIPLNDHYIFLRRMFKPIWSYYFLLNRILTFKNPLNELIAFWNAIDTKRVSLYKPHFKREDYDSFISKIVQSNPLISVIIPTYNRYENLVSVLSDLNLQNYTNFELLVVDQSEPFDKSVYEIFQGKLILIKQVEKELWRARNNAIRKSKGDYLLFLDDDSKISPDWILQHLKCIDYFKADISAGVSLSVIGAPIPVHYNYFRWADQLDTGNVLIRRTVFNKCGLFDQKFEKMRMGDGEFGLRCLINGFKSINNPLASRTHMKTATGGLREIGGWDGLRPKNWLSPKPIPSVLYFFRKYWGNKAALHFIVQTIPVSLLPYRFKGMRKVSIISSMLFILIFPIIFIQVILSWKIANRMLEEGSNIERIR